nr:immunoglobulin heavy chain junction region [Macaca mulatta]MOW80517.1 immunoglobulin heavy chain junction region [Macaca mulatta]MOW81989.1 immunoglobulin heavy chain junction region [Macaca mulatta]MOW83140.1 immunoglobulin heavy chain junction region [Macaca mulatta]
CASLLNPYTDYW